MKILKNNIIQILFRVNYVRKTARVGSSYGLWTIYVVLSLGNINVYFYALEGLVNCYINNCILTVYMYIYIIYCSTPLLYYYR